MAKTLEAVYYECEHTGAFKSGPTKVLPILKKHFGGACEASTFSLHHFTAMKGYRFNREGRQSFIPLAKSPPGSTSPFPFTGLLASKLSFDQGLLRPLWFGLSCLPRFPCALSQMTFVLGVPWLGFLRSDSASLGGLGVLAISIRLISTIFPIFWALVAAT